MRFTLRLKESGWLSLIADNDEDLNNQISDIRSALQENSKIGLDVSIRAAGDLWSAIFFNGDNLKGNFSISERNNKLFADVDVEIYISKLPSSINRALKSGDYKISLSGFFVKNKAIIADDELYFRNSKLTIS